MENLKELIITFVMSMLPVVELRAAIPYAIAHGIDWPVALTVAIIGCMLPVPFILLFMRKVLKIMLRFRLTSPFARWLESHAHAKSKRAVKYATAGLFLLAAIPLPGTGAWSSALAAAVLDLRIKNAVPTIFLGVVVEGVFFTLLSLGAIHVFGG